MKDWLIRISGHPEIRLQDIRIKARPGTDKSEYFLIT